MSNKKRRIGLNRISRCEVNHKNDIYQCNLVTDPIQIEFNTQYWNSNKERQDDFILKSVKVAPKLNSKKIDYKYFIFGYQVCSRMFIKTLGFKTRSRIEYLFRNLKKSNSLNSLKAPTDGRKNNRVKNRSHNQKFLSDLIDFVKSFKLVKKNRKFIIEDYKPIDLFKILCERLNYELIYENKNLKTKKKVRPYTRSNDLEHTNSNQQNFNQHNPNLQSNVDSNSNIAIMNEYRDDSMNLTNGSILLINEISSSQLTEQKSNQTVQNENNFYLFNQSINLINNQISRTINKSISEAQNVRKNSNLKNIETNEICSYSYFLRFLKKHNFEFK